MNTNTALERHEQGLGIRPALIVVDVTIGFTSTESPLGSEADDCVNNISKLVDAFHMHHLPVFLTTVVYSSVDQASVFRRRLPALNVLEAGSKWTQFDPRLTVLDTDVVVQKTHASAFHQTRLATQLEQCEADSLVVCGLTTSGCVRATAVDGLQWNYPVVVVEDACDDRDRNAHAANLYDLGAKYADIKTTANIIEALR